MNFKNQDFNLVHTFECGQCFRWDMNDDGSYTGVVDDNVINITQNDSCFNVDCEDIDLINDYFDLKRDYSEIKSTLSVADDVLTKAVPQGYGIRLLKQNPWETLVSFIISANNNIPRIKKIINSLCQNFGKEIKNGYYSFPDAERLKDVKKEELAFLRAGYRDSYLCDAISKVVSKEVNIETLNELSTQEAKRELLKIKGIGNKVADCILLFGNRRREIFPVDVWVKRSVATLYSEEIGEMEIHSFAQKKFGDFAGYAQQYLFYYMRENS